jgi:Zn-dependent protease
MAAVPLAVAAVTAAGGVAILLGAGNPSDIRLVLDEGAGRPPGIWHAMLLLLAFLASVCIHEPAHAMVAYWFGDTTAADYGRLTFRPERHIHPIATVLLPAVSLFLGFFIGWASTPVSPARMHPRKLGDLATSLAGPASNVLLAGAGAHLFLLSLLLSGFKGDFTGLLDSTSLPSSEPPAGVVVAYLFKLFAVFNLWLFLFNLLPLPVLDGGHALAAILPAEMADAFRRMGMIVSIIVLVVIGQYFYVGVVWLTALFFVGLGLGTGLSVAS